MTGTPAARRPFQQVRRLLILLAILLGGMLVGPLLAANLLWVTVSHHLAQPLAPPQPSEFLQRWAATTPRGSQAVGILAADRGDELLALAAWARAADPTQLILRGNAIERTGDLERALLYYRGANDAPYHPGWFAMGRLCQRMLATPEHLHPNSQARCHDLFRANDNNLLLNGGWTAESTEGWTFLGGEAVIDPSFGHPPPALILTGKANERRTFYQWVNLSPGVTVRFSALVRREGPPPQRLELLTINFVKDGTPAGSLWNGLEQVPPDGAWRHVARTYRTPAVDGNRFRFTPVFVEGEHLVQIDEIRLEIVEAP